MCTNTNHGDQTGDAIGPQLAATVPVTVIERWLELLGQTYREHAWRFACEHEARTLGVFDRDDERESWCDGMVRGIWYLFAAAVFGAPLLLRTRGRMLADADDTAPPRYRMLHIDPDTGCGLGVSPAAAIDFRAGLAFDRAAEILHYTDIQSHVDWQFAKQLLGLDPTDNTDGS